MATVWFLVLLFAFVNGEKDCGDMKCLRKKLPLLDNIRAPLVADIDMTSMNDDIEKYINDVIESKINAVAIEQSNKIEQTLNNLKSKVIIAAATKVTQQLSGFQTSLDALKSEKPGPRVAVTACVGYSYTYSWQSKVRFKSISSQSGPIDTDALNNGYFKCTSAGLYMVSFTLVSEGKAYFSIYKNDVQVNFNYISNDDQFDSGTSVVALELNVNDTVSIRPGMGDVEFASNGSCLTIIKIA